MKKFFALAAVAAMFIACGGNENENEKPNGGEGNGNQTEEPAPESAIKIDGNFADWAEVEVVSATLPSEGTAAYEQLKVVKVYADELYIYFYAEYDPTNIYAVDLFIDTDNDITTGCVGSDWANGLDVLMQGGIYSWTADKTTQLEAKAYDPGANYYGGEPGTNEWNWVSAVDSGVVTSCVPVANANGDLSAIEFAVMREMIPMELGSTVAVGIIIETRGWSTVGKLPQAAAEDETIPAALVIALP